MSGDAANRETAEDHGPTRPFQHHGTGSEAFGLGFTNLLLNVITLFFWRFWGRTRVRWFLWSRTTAWGDPLDYTGTGKELFLGFLIVFIAVFLPLSGGLSVANGLVQSKSPGGLPMLAGLQGLTVFLAAAGLYRARRYQLSRTRWRGIRGGLDGEAWRYGLLALALLAGSAVTLGWLWPWGDLRLARYRLRHTTFGDRRFTCDVKAGEAYTRFAILWLGAVVVFAIWMTVIGVIGSSQLHQPLEKSEQAKLVGASLVIPLLGALALAPVWAWYKATIYRTLIAGTRFGEVRFAADIRTWPLLRLMLGNALLTVLTLGIGRPWAAVRTLRFTCTRLTIDGVPDFAAIRQGTQEQPRLGEGLAAVFDGVGEF